MPFLGMPFLTRSFFELTPTPNSKATTSPTVFFFCVGFETPPRNDHHWRLLAPTVAHPFHPWDPLDLSHQGLLAAVALVFLGSPLFSWEARRIPVGDDRFFLAKKHTQQTYFCDVDWIWLDVISQAHAKKRPILIMIGLNAIQTRWPFLSGA